MERDIKKLYEEFALQLRTEMTWNEDLFEELFCKMKVYCKEVIASKSVDREIAGVFWNASWWVKGQIEGIEKFKIKYYQNAVTNIDHLAWWLFENHSREDNEFEPM